LAEHDTVKLRQILETFAETVRGIARPHLTEKPMRMPPTPNSEKDMTTSIPCSGFYLWKIWTPPSAKIPQPLPEQCTWIFT
jgi:hypothetical protein